MFKNGFFVPKIRKEGETMADFQAAQGLVHLLFANEDTYITDGLIRLPLERYLYMKLKKEGYEKVVFLNDINGPIYQFLDEKSKDAYVEYRNSKKTSIFQTKAADEIEYENRRFVRRFKKTEGMTALHRILDMLERHTRLAVVLPVDWFVRFSEEEELEACLQEINKKNYVRNNLLLVHFPVAAESIRTYFESPVSIFRSVLFPEIKAVFERYEKVFLFDALKQELGNRVTFFNELNYPELRNLVRHIYFYHVDGTGENFDIDKVAAFLWGWYHSDCLRFVAENVMPANDQRRFDVIYSGLRDQRTRDNIRRVIADLETNYGDGNKSLREIIQTLGINKKERLLWENNVYYTKLNRAYELVYKECRTMGFSTLKQLEAIVNTLKSPCFPKSASLLNISETMPYLTKAYETSDEVLMNRTVQALKYAICDCNEVRTQSDAEQQIRNRELTCWELYMTSLKLAEELHNTNASVREFADTVNMLEMQLAEAQEDVKRYQEQNPQVFADDSVKSGGNISAEYHIYSTKKSKVTGLYNNLVMNKNCLAQNLSLVSSYQDYLQKIEMQINALKLGVNKEIAKDIMVAKDLMGEIWMDQQKQLKELKELGQGFSLSLDEQGDMFRGNVGQCTEFEERLAKGEVSEAEMEQEMYDILNSL